MRTANIYGPHAYRLLGHPRIEQHSDGFAVRLNFCGYRVVRDGGALRFRLRRVDILLVLPL